jgi:putative peptide zinc metalloprotease protein
MSGSLFSNQWYRVAKLRPRLRSNVRSNRQYYRDVVWYVVTAASSKTRLRVNASAFHVLSQLNGERTVDEIWRTALDVLQDGAPSQDEIVDLLARLFDASFVDFQKQTDVDRLFENVRTRERQESRSRYWNPLFLRFAVYDPDRLTQRLIPHTRWLFSRTTFCVWLLLMLVGLVLSAFFAGDIMGEINSDLLSPFSLLTFWIVFPVMKLIHESSHALAVKRWGGEVHEFGVALLVMMPIPYVDATDSARFGSKYRRMAVAGAGIIAETTLAFLGLLVWITVEPGIVSGIAFNCFLTGSVSSVLFNGNPLLKFDSYYVLSDMIEIPGLASRSNQYLLYLVRRYLLGLQSVSPVTAKGEQVWFVGYGLSALAYRLFLTFGICIFVASKYFFIGVALALWSIGMQIVWPLLKGVGFLLKDPQVQATRIRAYAAVAGIATVAAVVMFWAPVPNTTHARGVVWPVDDAMVRAGTDCFIDDVAVTNGQLVSAGANLMRCDATQIEAEVRSLQAELLAARASLFATRDRVERGLRQSEVDTVQELLHSAEEDLAGTSLDANADGYFFAHDADNLSGRYFSQGEVVGYILQERNVSVRTMLDQDRVALLDEKPADVEILANGVSEGTLSSAIVRRVPAASYRLVTPALGVMGGGDLIVDPSDESGALLHEAAFEIELELPAELRDSPIGTPVEVRLNHGSDSIAGLLARQVRLLLLRRFSA